MAARNELLRRDGRHTAAEFLEKIEGKLVTRPAVDAEPESLAAPGEDSTESSAPKASWSTLMPQASGTESSAWIPAVRPPPKEGDR